VIATSHMVADALGPPLDHFGISAKEMVPAPEDLLLSKSGALIKKGAAAGVGWQFTGESGGRPFSQVTVEIAVAQPVGPGIIELNAARAVNSVSRVVEAPAGCRSILDFPAATGSGAA
jgi:hypothetical protein